MIPPNYNDQGGTTASPTPAIPPILCIPGVAGKKVFFVRRDTLWSKLEIPNPKNMISLVGAIASLVN